MSLEFTLWVPACRRVSIIRSDGTCANDVVLQVDTQSIRNENHLINLISTFPSGQRIRLEVWRDRKMLTLEAVVGDWSQGQNRFRSP